MRMYKVRDSDEFIITTRPSVCEAINSCRVDAALT